MALYFQETPIWKKSLLLVEDIYLLLKKFPKEEQYALTDQMRRASISIISNISEGSGRNTDKEYIQFLHIAKGSAMELHTQTILAERFHYITQGESLKVQEEIEEIIKMLYGMIRAKK